MSERAAPKAQTDHLCLTRRAARAPLPGPLAEPREVVGRMRGVENPVRRTEDRADPVRGCIPHPANKMFVAVELHDCHGSAWRSAEVTLSANTTAMTSALENMKLTIVPKMNNCSQIGKAALKSVNCGRKAT